MQTERPESTRFSSWSGRISRGDFFWQWVGLTVLNVVVFAVIGGAGFAAERSRSTFGQAIAGIALLAYLVISLGLLSRPAVRRLHDLNGHGAYALLYLIPIVGQVLWLVCLFKKGTEGPNRFGPDPLVAEPLSGALEAAAVSSIDPSLKGTCPGCDAVIPMNSTECPRCKCVLNAPDGWRTKALDQ